MNLALTYDDIQLVPAYSTIKSRQNIKLHTMLTKRYGLLQPLVASPMDTVCDGNMAIAMANLGGVGVIHRFMTIEEQCEVVSVVKYATTSTGSGTLTEKWGVMSDDWHAEIKQIPVAVAIGVQTEDRLRAVKLVEAGANVLVIDVAHGDHKNVIDMVKWCKEQPTFEHVDIIAGNIATAEAALRLEAAGADGLRVGIGGGSLCTTRIKTGFGIPNVTAITQIQTVATVPVMADGGIRTSGDISKALAIGASTVMIGSLIAGTEEAPGKVIEKNGSLFKRYRGSASLETKVTHGQAARNVEGESTVIPFKGGVKYIITDLLDGVKSALSYAGAKDLNSFNPDIVQITNAGQLEAKPHLLY
jgi:IMP dehydrogenase